ncbi:MAG: glycosyltransferase, partial [Actinobacteria bacterium]|nr:glycosyltransferase [Actinomycetota bacterium]
DLLRERCTPASQNKIIVGYVGRLANEKKIEDLAPLHAREDVQLVIVGDGPARQRLERALPKAHFVGYQSGEDLAAHYASFDIFVHTGKHETFCQSIQESLASGVPVIAPVPELIVSPDCNPVADHDATGPPELDGAVMDTTEPRVKVCAEMVPITGIGWTTAKENDFESVPA